MSIFGAPPPREPQYAKRVRNDSFLQRDFFVALD